MTPPLKIVYVEYTLTASIPALIAAAKMEERKRCAQRARDFAWVLPVFTDAAINEATDAAACAVQDQIATMLGETE